MMDQLEEQAIDKTEEKDKWKKATLEVFREGRLSEQQLEIVIEKSFILGHGAGHCRGEGYKRKNFHGAPHYEALY